MDRRSPEAEAYRRLYNSVRWRRRSRQQLSSELLCERCHARGRIAVATVAHHRVPHKGDEALFWYGALESLCKHCHDSEAKQQEVRGYSTAIGADGWPLDPRHPANKG